MQVAAAYLVASGPRTTSCSAKSLDLSCDFGREAADNMLGVRAAIPCPGIAHLTGASS
jgi:hypothetical protein